MLTISCNFYGTASTQLDALVYGYTRSVKDNAPCIGVYDNIVIYNNTIRVCCCKIVIGKIVTDICLSYGYGGDNATFQGLETIANGSKTPLWLLLRKASRAALWARSTILPKTGGKDVEVCA